MGYIPQVPYLLHLPGGMFDLGCGLRFVRYRMEYMVKKRFYKRWWFWVLVVVAIGGGIFGWVKMNQNKDLETNEIKRGEVKEELILSGEVKAVEHAILKFQSSGELDWIGVSEGERVKKGQVLAKLDTYSLYQQYEQAVANLRKYQASADKVLDDVKDHDDDETWEQRDDRTTAEANRDSAYRALEVARKNLANANLKAPFAGIVTNISNPFTGVNTTLAESQIEIVNPETMYFEVMVEQTDLTDLSLGQEVKMVMDAYLEDEWVGEIESITYTPSTGEAGTVYEVKVVLKNLSTDKLRVGMTGDSSFVLKQDQDVLYVPSKFVNSENGDKYLNLGGRRKKVDVEIGLEGEEVVEVRGDIKEGDVIYD